MRIADIAEQQRIPRKFLEHILLDLKRDGILASRRGKLGSYELLITPDQITFGSSLNSLMGRSPHFPA